MIQGLMEVTAEQIGIAEKEIRAIKGYSSCEVGGIKAKCFGVTLDGEVTVAIVLEREDKVTIFTLTDDSFAALGTLLLKMLAEMESK